MEEFPGGIARAWSFPVLPAIAICLSGAVYAVGRRRAGRTRPRELPPWRAASFYAGLLALWVALASPIDALDDFLLAAHMLQHFLLMSIVPPLLVLGAPAVPLLRGLPRPFIRKILGPLMRTETFRRVSHLVTHPIFAWFAMNLAYLGWHVPAAFELTLYSELWHSTEHLCFLLTSVLFWWVILCPWPGRRRWPVWMFIPYLFSADLVNTVLSAFLSFSGRVLYPSYAHAARISRLGPLEDQIAAGSEMWVLNSVVFLVPAVLLIMRTLTPQFLRHATVEDPGTL